MSTSTQARPIIPREGRGRLRWRLLDVLIGVVIVLGAGVLLYPTAAQYFSDRAHATEVSGYVNDVKGSDPVQSSERLERAREYNKNLPQGPLRDPYLLNSEGAPVSVDLSRKEYNKTLSVPGTETMARVRVPSIKVDLLVYHGTEDATLRKGIGHLYGTSLPVGGQGEHTVLTGHSGLADARFFSDLNQVKKGDLVIISVEGEDLWYRVDQIETVLPNDAELLRRTPGRDDVTLITCTPTGVNTHRLLVRAARVDAPAQEKAEEVLGANAADPGFPWWAVGMAAALAAGFFLARPRRVTPTENNDTEDTTDQDHHTGDDPEGQLV